MTLLKELIRIPESVHKSDFVVRLTEGVRDVDATVRDYVVTPDLARCFDRALSLIKSAVESRSSKAAYLHGSFGSGKSHFMAMLYLLLRNEPRVRGVGDLAGVVNAHATWLEGKKFLLVPYHMIGARNVESHLLGHYVEFVRTQHPNAPIPPVFLADRIFENAGTLRTQMKDEAFFAALNAGGSGGGWGELEAAWEPASFERAISAAPGDPERSRLVSALVTKLLTAYEDVASASGEGFVPLDEGLSLLSKHAHDLGYHGLILFLDELILWLASHAADLPFLEREAQKLSKLVEAQCPDRPIPIVSFIARQRDLRELVGEHVPGAERLSFSDVLRYWEGRFDQVTLGNQNLPTIVEKRLLEPKGESARIQIDQAFRETTQAREEVMRVLLGSEANPEQFRALYPFSPALVQALVAVSSVLQRERTALRLLLQLLVEQRDSLELGSLIPVGDLFDVLSEGEEPFSEEMKEYFDNARKLYREKIRPLLEAEHQLTYEEAARRPASDPQARALRGDDRIAKTLILAALTPEVEAFRGLTAARLAALNHGSIRAPLPGREAATVLQKCRKWAAQIGEIRISDDPNPTIALHITGVDTEGILEKAIGEDNPGNRRRKIREILFREIGITEADDLFTSHELVWRGTKRKIDVVFGNVASSRDLPDETLKASGDNWKLVLDFPFEAEGHGPRDDYARLERFGEIHGRTRTVCWIPSTFSPEALRDLGRLVRLDHILAGERFNDFASHLSVVDRQQARILLENQQNQLRQRVKFHIEVAYGIVPGTTMEGERLVSLEPSFPPRPPVGANLTDACLGLLDQALACQYPAHPRLLDQAGAATLGSDTRPVRPTDLKKVLDAVLDAVQAADGRILVQERPLRALLRQIANPLKLGEMHETPFLLGHHWKDHFQQKVAADGGPLTVGKLRAWTDEPVSIGLPREIQALVILVFAAQTNRSFVQNGGPYPASLDRDIPDDVALVSLALPAKAAWEEALKRAGALFGVSAPSQLLNASNVAELASALQEKARAWREPAERFVHELERRCGRCGVGVAGAGRLATAKAGVAACQAVLAQSKPAGVVEALAAVSVPMPQPTILHALGKVDTALRALADTQWTVVEASWALQDHRAAAAAALKTRTAEILQKDEIALALGTELRKVQDDAARLLAEPVPRPPVQPTGPVGPSVPLVSPRPAPGWKALDTGERTAIDSETARQVLDQLKAKLGPRRRLTLTWRIEEKEGE